MTKTKSQKKLNIQIFNIQNRFGHLRIGFWRLSGRPAGGFIIWILLFGAYLRSIINKFDRHILTQ